ncbi:type I polyketide synthase, partial [Micromonospora gifhornensis]|uniref:type I polyketide synthase n=1 Tax=Micromonospora gifhornensis TaxID=84594 RepID=UPI0034556CE7
AWETFEQAGIDPRSLRGSDTGVFCGVMYHDYAARAARPPADLEGYLLVGNTASAVSGRLAYVYGLNGPTLTVDTACSSSLVALHLAATALRRGECSAALVGGVTVMASPTAFVEFSRQRALATDGRCRSFAADATGTGWSEGAGLLLLERLSVARAKGHQILAVVSGSAVNSDGASNGMTAPNGPAQERVIRTALGTAGLSASDVDVVEAHGTGTSLGDPIEAQAVLATYGSRTGGVPVLLGSLKSNIGHAQAAAGVGGVIKMVQAIRAGVAPRSLHCEVPSPMVDWDSGAVQLLSTRQDWPDTGRPRRAAVSSFGISGTNAHVILEQAPAADIEPAAGTEAGSPVAWVVSGHNPAALSDQARALHDLVTGPQRPDPTSVAVALTRRTVLHRWAVVTGTDPDTRAAALAALATGGSAPGLTPGPAGPRGRLAFLFTGQGSQRIGMGRTLYDRSAPYRRALDDVCAHLDGHLDQPLRDILFADPDSADAALLGQTVFTQAALFATEVALYRHVEACGVRPDTVLGHSVGGITAAHVAGVFDLADAARLIAARGHAMQAARDDGAMIALDATEDEVRDWLAGRTDLTVAAVNAPRSTVVAGDRAAAQDTVEHWRSRGRRATALPVSHAFHSHHMDGVLDEFRQAIEGLTFREPVLTVVSDTTGDPATASELGSADYWVRHVRRPVRFADAVRTLHRTGVTDLVEIGPDAVLTGLAAATLGDPPGLVVPMLRAGRDEPETVLTALALLHGRGVPVDWERVHPGTRPVPLPTYRFRRRRYWLDARAAGPAAAGQHDTAHPLLGAAVDVAGSDTAVLTGRLDAAGGAWLAEHRPGDVPLVPGSALTDLVLRAGAQVACHQLAELTLSTPLPFDGREPVAVQVVADAPADDGSRTVAVYARPAGAAAGHPWTRHADGLLTPAPTPAPPSGPWPPQDAEPVALDDVYDRLAGLGYHYGPAFRRMTRLWRRPGERYVEVTLAEDQLPEAAGYALHPALLDAALHPLLPLVAAAPDEVGAEVLPFAFTGVRLHASGASTLRVTLTVHETGEDGTVVSLSATDPAGGPVLTVERLRLLPRAAGPTAVPDGLHRLTWRPVPAPNGAPVDAAALGLPDATGLSAYATVGDLPATAAVFVAAPDGDPAATPPQRVRQSLTATLDLLRRWLADDTRAELVLVTRNAVATTTDADPDPVQAAVWGLVRSAQAEQPGRFRLVDVDGTDPSWAALAAVAATTEPQTAIRAGRLLAPRLAPVTRAGTEARPDLSGGPVLVTGATGTLGAVLARHLVTAYGATDLVLLSRRGPAAPDADRLAEELTGLGAAVRTLACDVSDRAALAAVLDGLDRPPAAVAHVAGTTRDRTITALTGDDLDHVLAPKVDAAWHLHELTADRPPALFLLYSSVAGTLGTAGQGNYAAANAFLDALAQHRRAAGLPAVSLGWGLWAQSSALSGHLSDTDRQRVARLGLRPLADEEAMRLFDAALTDGGPAFAVTRFDVRRLTDPPAVLRDLAVPALPAASAAVAADRPALAAQLAGRSPEQRRDLLTGLVRAQVAGVLGRSDPDGIDLDRALTDLGFDSLTAVELRNRLGTATGHRLPATLAFDHPTPAALVGYLDDLMADSPPDDGVHAELDRLEALLRDGGPGDGTIADRLRQLLTLAAPDSPATVDLDTASDEALFALIDDLD